MAVWVGLCDSAIGQRICSCSMPKSNSSAARPQMDKVRELVASGRTDEQIRGFYTSRYGEWALLEPPATGKNLLVWVLPLLLLLGGAVAIARTMRRPASAPPAPPAEPETDKDRPPPDDPGLEAVRAELRR